MTAVARMQLPLRPAGPDTVAALLAWYDAERRDLPWRAQARAAARSVPRLAQRDHAAADDGEGGHPLLPPFPRALADGAGARRVAARRRTRDVGGAWLLQHAHAICTHVRRWSPKSMAGAFRAPKPGCAICRDRPLHRGGDRGDRIRQRRRRSTATSNGSSRAFSPMRMPLPAAKPRDQKARRHADAIASSRRFRAGDDGSGRHDLHAEASVVPDVSAAGGLPCALTAGSRRRCRRRRQERSGRHALASPLSPCARMGGSTAAAARAGLLGGMMEVPSTEWRNEWVAGDDALASRRCAETGGRCQAV